MMMIKKNYYFIHRGFCAISTKVQMSITDLKIKGNTPRTKRNDSEVFLERGDAGLTDRFIFFSLRRIRRKH